MNPETQEIFAYIGIYFTCWVVLAAIYWGTFALVDYMRRRTHRHCTTKR